MTPGPAGSPEFGKAAVCRLEADPRDDRRDVSSKARHSVPPDCKPPFPPALLLQAGLPLTNENVSVALRPF